MTIIRRLDRLLLALALAGLCACSATIDEATPVATRADGLPAGPVNTGTYPDLNRPAVGAAAQLTPEETAAKSGTLAATRSRVRSGRPAAPSRQDDLRSIGRSHAEATLNEIERTAPAE